MKIEKQIQIILAFYLIYQHYLFSLFSFLANDRTKRLNYFIIHMFISLHIHLHTLRA